MVIPPYLSQIGRGNYRGLQRTNAKFFLSVFIFLFLHFHLFIHLFIYLFIYLILLIVIFIYLFVLNRAAFALKT